MGNASLLRRKWTVLSDDDRGTALHDIEDESNRLHGVVSNMLRLSRPERVVAPELEPLLLRRLVDRAVERHAARFPVPAVHIVERDSVPPVLGHEEYPGQVLDILLSNAAKYGSRTEPIELRIDRVDGRAQLSVLDRGPGIDRALRERIFVAFERLPDAATKGEGLGLGLPICRMLMNAQGGDVDVADREGGGSAFTVSLRLAEEELEQERGTPEQMLAESH